MSLLRRPPAPPPPAPTHDLSEALQEIAEALGEVYKHVALIERRLGYIEQSIVSQPSTRPVTLVTLEENPDA